MASTGVNTYVRNIIISRSIAECHLYIYIIMHVINPVCHENLGLVCYISQLAEQIKIFNIYVHISEHLSGISAMNSTS